MNKTLTSFIFLMSVAIPAHAIELGNGGNGADCKYEDYAELVGAKEGGAAQWHATNPGSTATGMFQFTRGTLADLGFIVKDNRKLPGGAGEWANTTWTGKFGVNSREDFMNSPDAQRAALKEFTDNNVKNLGGYVGRDLNGVPMTEGGVAFVAHHLGAGTWNPQTQTGTGAKCFLETGDISRCLDQKTIDAHNGTEAMNRHLMQRLADGACVDLGNFTQPSDWDLPEVYLMKFISQAQAIGLKPGQMRGIGPEVAGVSAGNGAISTPKVGSVSDVIEIKRNNDQQQPFQWN